MLFFCARSGCGRRPFRLIFGNRLRQLIGTGRAVSATNPREQVFDFVEFLSLDKAGDPLKIAATAADKAHVMKFVFGVDVEEDLSRTGSFRGISKHSLVTSMIS